MTPKFHSGRCNKAMHILRSLASRATAPQCCKGVLFRQLCRKQNGMDALNPPPAAAKLLHAPSRPSAAIGQTRYTRGAISVVHVRVQLGAVAALSPFLLRSALSPKTKMITKPNKSRLKSPWPPRGAFSDLLYDPTMLYFASARWRRTKGKGKTGKEIQLQVKAFLICCWKLEHSK